MGDTLHLFTIPHWINHVGLGVVAVVAFWKGGWREKAIVAFMIASALLNHAICDANDCWRGAEYHRAITRDILEDAALLALVLAATIGAKRYWVVALASVALLHLLTSLIGPLLHPQITPWAWLSANLIWEWLCNGILVWGSLTTARDRGRPAPA